MRTVDRVRFDIQSLLVDPLYPSAESLDRQLQLSNLLDELERVKVEYVRDDIISLLNEVK